LNMSQPRLIGIRQLQQYAKPVSGERTWDRAASHVPTHCRRSAHYWRRYYMLPGNGHALSKAQLHDEGLLLKTVDFTITGCLNDVSVAYGMSCYDQTLESRVPKKGATPGCLRNQITSGHLYELFRQPQCVKVKFSATKMKARNVQWPASL
jgi:hypothetical protein